MRDVLVSVNHCRRIRVYPAGGLHLEAYAEGPGWVLHNDAEVPDAVLYGYLAAAAQILTDAAAKLKG